MKTKKIPTIISVDWDYFLPFCTDRKYDWGHHEENAFFYEMAWACRAMPWPDDLLAKVGAPKQPDLVKEIQIDRAQVVMFWSKGLKNNPRRRYMKVSVQDSHGKMLDFARQWPLVNVINFDAHHDAGYNQVVNPDCSNWAHFLRREKRLYDYTQVYPAWRKDEPESNIPKCVDRVIYGPWPDDAVDVAGVFLCRSSCWMPPWLDRLFNELRELLIYRGPCTGIQSEYVTKPRKWPIVVNESK